MDGGLLSHCGSPGHSVASNSGLPGRGMASLVAPSNGTDLNRIVIHFNVHCGVFTGRSCLYASSSIQRHTFSEIQPETISQKSG